MSLLEGRSGSGFTEEDVRGFMQSDNIDPMRIAEVRKFLASKREWELSMSSSVSLSAQEMETYQEVMDLYQTDRVKGKKEMI